MIKTLRRLRAALGNGLVWGVTWATSAFVAYGGLGLLGAFEGVANPLGDTILKVIEALGLELHAAAGSR